jgi:putative SOS response-associated peptidase YedK
VKSIVEGKLDEAGLTAAERALLEYVELITHAAYRSTPEDVEKLRVAGWKEEQISEAVYITALFAFFNRVADAFGVPFQDWKDASSNWIKTCSILTTTPNAVTSAVHNRKPVILDPDSYDLWLDPGMMDVGAASDLFYSVG